LKTSVDFTRTGTLERDANAFGSTGSDVALQANAVRELRATVVEP